MARLFGFFILAMLAVALMAQVLPTRVPDPLSIQEAQIDLALIDAIRAGTVDAGYVNAVSSTTDALRVGTIDAGHLNAVRAGVDSLVAGVIDAGTLYALVGAVDELAAGNIDAGHMHSALTTTDALHAGTASTNQLHVGVVDAGHLRSSTASVDQLVAGLIDAGYLNAGSSTIILLRASQLDAGQVTASIGAFDLLTAGTLDAGTTYTHLLLNVDGGLVYAPNGLRADAQRPIALGTALIQDTGGVLSINAGPGKLTGVVDGFFVQGDSTFGQLSVDAVRISGGATTGTIAVVGGISGPTMPSTDAGLLIVGGLPNGPVTIVNAVGLYTPRIGNQDGGAVHVSGTGLASTRYTDTTGYGFSFPVASTLLPCGHPDAGVGTIVTYSGLSGPREWQCTLGSQIACPGCWEQPHNAVNPFYARAPSDVLGVTNSSGIDFYSVDPGTERSVLGGLGVKVIATGQNGTATIAKWRIYQHNYADGGQRDIAHGAMACTAPVGSCARYSNIGVPASSGCTLPVTVDNAGLTFSVGGPVEMEWQPDGGQCLANPDFTASGYTINVVNPDGGPP